MAYQWLDDERTRIKSGVPLVALPKTRFAEFAALLFERKVTTREIKSARSRERWKYTLEYLIGGTADVPGFGEMFVDRMQVAHVLSWQSGHREARCDGPLRAHHDERLAGDSAGHHDGGQA